MYLKATTRCRMERSPAAGRGGRCVSRREGARLRPGRGPRHTRSGAHLSGCLGALLVVFFCGLASAQRTEPPPRELEGVGVTEHLGDRIPIDLEFVDEQGQTVRLGRYFKKDRPVILNLGYYRCPMLCGLVLNALLDRLKELSWTPGREFEILTISVDPHETPALAQLKKQSYLQEYGRAPAAAGWHFLVGEEADIRKLASAVGFGYRYVEDQDQYAHPAVIMLLTPDGRISRYLDGLDYTSGTLRLSLAEASEGGLGSPLDRLILQCFHYDPDSGRYAPVARRIMAFGGLVTVIVLGLVLLAFWRREARRRSASGAGGERGHRSRKTGLTDAEASTELGSDESSRTMDRRPGADESH